MIKLCLSVQPISIHAPREGGDTETLAAARKRRYFNPRPPRGGRHLFKRT